MQLAPVFQRDFAADGPELIAMAPLLSRARVEDK